MGRRRFIKLITCLPLISLYPASLIGSQDTPGYDPGNILLLQAKVAGFRYYRGENVLQYINSSDPITLKRESQNPYDHKAVALYWRNEKMVYIPKSDNSVIADLLDQGAPLNANIRKKNSSPAPRERLEVRVELEN